MIKVGDLVKFKSTVSNNQRPMLVTRVKSSESIKQARLKTYQSIRCWDSRFGDTGWQDGTSFIILSRNIS